MQSRALLLVLALVASLAILAAWMCRYHVTPTASARIAFLLDRWTGQLYLVQDGERDPVTDFKPPPPNPPKAP